MLGPKKMTCQFLISKQKIQNCQAYCVGEQVPLACLAAWAIVALQYTCARTYVPALHKITTFSTLPASISPASESKDSMHKEKVSDESLRAAHLDWGRPKAATAACSAVGPRSAPYKSSRDEEDEFPALHLKQPSYSKPVKGKG